MQPSSGSAGSPLTLDAAQVLDIEARIQLASFASIEIAFLGEHIAGLADGLCREHDDTRGLVAETLARRVEALANGICSVLTPWDGATQEVAHAMFPRGLDLSSRAPCELLRPRDGRHAAAAQGSA
jgi:hypothetical protein